MKLKLIILFLAVIVGLYSCYDDKGNYDYKELTSIEIEEFSTIHLTLGDTLRINPVFTYSSADTVMNLEYTWTLGGKVIGKQRNLEYVPDSIFSANCVLKVEDLDNGVHFLQHCIVNINFKYDVGGFLVLSEKNNLACLSFMREEKVKWAPDYSSIDSIDFTLLENIYKQENGEELTGRPVKVHEHFCEDDGSKGQTLVLMDNGLTDVNSLTFKKDVTGEDIFAGGWPAGLKPADVLYMQWVDLITDEQGHLYTRLKASNKLFNSDYFLPEPMTFEGEVMEKIQPVLGRFQSPQFCLLYDGKNNRFLTLLDVKDDWDGEYYAGKIQKLDVLMAGGSYPEGFVPLEDLGDYKVRYAGCIDWGYSDLTYWVVLEKGGKYYEQEFNVYRSGELFTISGTSFREFNGAENVIDENSVIYALPYKDMGKYTFISKGNELYLYDRESPSNGVRWFYTFDGEVTCMDAEYYLSRCMGVGLANGRVAVVRVQGAKNAQDDEKKIYWISEPDVHLGKVKSIRYKVRHGNGWT